MQRGVRHLRALKLYYKPHAGKYSQMDGGMTEWVQDGWLDDFVKRNPDVQIDLRRAEDPLTTGGDSLFPRAVAYYLNGTATTRMLKTLSVEGVNDAIYELRNTCNQETSLPHQTAVLESDLPSVQGVWSPYLWMKDGPKHLAEGEDAGAEDEWKEEITQIAKYVRLKKEHREMEFQRRHHFAAQTRKRMEARWQEEVFPYTVGKDTAAVPGRLFLEETRTIFPEAGQKPPASAQEPGGGGFMGGFVSPFSKAETTALGTDGPAGIVGTGDKYSTAKTQRSMTVPPFAGAPFSSGYGEYENFWKNWDLFHYSSQRYRPPTSEFRPVEGAKARKQYETMQRMRREQHRNDNWAKES